MLAQAVKSQQAETEHQQQQQEKDKFEGNTNKQSMAKNDEEMERDSTLDDSSNEASLKTATQEEDERTKICTSKLIFVPEN